MKFKKTKETRKVFILTDECMWESNKQSGARAPHTIAAIDEKTGQMRWIKGGSRIRFVAGEISEPHKQEDYNKLTSSTHE